MESSTDEGTLAGWPAEALLLRDVYQRPRDACAVGVEDAVELAEVIRVDRRLQLAKGRESRLPGSR